MQASGAIVVQRLLFVDKFSTCISYFIQKFVRSIDTLPRDKVCPLNFMPAFTIRFLASLIANIEARRDICAISVAPETTVEYGDCLLFSTKTSSQIRMPSFEIHGLLEKSFQKLHCSIDLEDRSLNEGIINFCKKVEIFIFKF